MIWGKGGGSCGWDGACGEASGIAGKVLTLDLGGSYTVALEQSIRLCICMIPICVFYSTIKKRLKRYSSSFMVNSKFILGDERFNINRMWCQKVVEVMEYPNQCLKCAVSTWRNFCRCVGMAVHSTPASHRVWSQIVEHHVKYRARVRIGKR